jgi:lipoyl synthase
MGNPPRRTDGSLAGVLRKAKTMDLRESPDYVQTSLAASLTLGLREGSFHRNAKLRGLNLLLRYHEGCLGRCQFCGLSQSRTEERAGKTFIRVEWPVYSLAEIIENTKGKQQIKRVCVSMLTHPKAVVDTCTVVERMASGTGLPVSVLVAPTPIADEFPLRAMKDAGADRAGIAIDAATPPLFDSLRGSGTGGPHRWDHYWDIVEKAVGIFGEFQVGIHLIVGLGETEREMIAAMQAAQDRGAHTHLFSFFPEKGSPMEHRPPPPLKQYRTIQLARWIINENLGCLRQMSFDPNGNLTDFGIDICSLLKHGDVFMTSGCPGRDGIVACNRPYGNERPSGPIRNFPFSPEPEDIEEIRAQLENTSVQAEV